MRPAPLALAMLALSPALGMLAAKEPPVEVFLSLGDKARQITGISQSGEPKSFKIRASTARVITFSLNAGNDDCGAEMRASSQVNFLPGYIRFPISQVQDAKEGETFILSFFQTRSAWMSKTPCSFSFTVQ